MSQDSETCVKCGKLCGYDGGKVYSDEHNKAYCGQCTRNMIERIRTFFGIDSCSWDSSAFQIDWDDIVKILDKIKRDYEMRISYIVTDKELYERTTQIKTPIEKEG